MSLPIDKLASMLLKDMNKLGIKRTRERFKRLEGDPSVKAQDFNELQRILNIEINIPKSKVKVSGDFKKANVEELATIAIKENLKSIAMAVGDHLAFEIENIIIDGITNEVKSTVKGRSRRKKNVGKSRGLVTLDTNETSSNNDIGLITLLNTKINSTVPGNMVLPALVWRTGRFAESVRILSIDRTAKNTPVINYTYQTFPYQVFEMGRGRPPWATPERDPRTLIDKSIREIATEILVTRFNTRRL